MWVDNRITWSHLERTTSNMTSSVSIKEEIDIFEEDIAEHYPTHIKQEVIPFHCENMKEDEIIFHAEPSRWLEEPMDIPIYSDGEANICLLCQYIAGARLTSDMKRKRSVHNKWCLKQQHRCLECGLNLTTEPKTRKQKSMENTHLQSCVRKNK